MTMDALAIFGGGKIGEALLSGWLRGQYTPDDVVVCEKHPERAQYLSSTYGVKTVDVTDAVTAARTLLIAVKPQDLATLLEQMRPVATPDHLVVSVAAGVPTSSIERGLQDGVPVVRCMPNTPALVDQAMTAVAAGRHASEQHLDVAERLLAAVGRVVRV